MPFKPNLLSFITAVGTTIKDVRLSIAGVSTTDAAGVGAALTTTSGNLVGAINELKVLVDAVDVTDVIDDSVTSAVLAWSSNKTAAEIATAVTALVDSSPGTLDTLNELAAALGDDPNFATTITAQLALKANIADTYSVTQLGADLDTEDLVAAWTAAIA